jgi:hypothetical protein
MFLTKDNADPDPSSPKYRQDSVHHVSKRAYGNFCSANSPTHNSLVLTRYLPKTKIRKERKLLQDNVEGDGQQEPEVRSRSPLTFSLR